MSRYDLQHILQFRIHIFWIELPGASALDSEHARAGSKFRYFSVTFWFSLCLQNLFRTALSPFLVLSLSSGDRPDVGCCGESPLCIATGQKLEGFHGATTVATRQKTLGSMWTLSSFPYFLCSWSWSEAVWFFSAFLPGQLLSFAGLSWTMAQVWGQGCDRWLACTGRRYQGLKSCRNQIGKVGLFVMTVWGPVKQSHGDAKHLLLWLLWSSLLYERVASQRWFSRIARFEDPTCL